MVTQLTPAVPVVPVPEVGRDTLGHLYRPSQLDVPVSYFDTAYANVPSQTTTLRQMVTTRYYQQQIEAIRAETNPAEQAKRKKLLPAFTLSLLHHRRKDAPVTEQVRQQWPLLMGDVDQKDNPNLNMAIIKQDIARLPYVLLCAYSVRGGLWFVVRLPDHQTPTTLQAHFRYVEMVFAEKFEIVLDRSKGGNPTHLRYVSHDPAPYLNEAASVLRGTYTMPPALASTQPAYAPRYNGTNAQPQHHHDLLNRVLQLAAKANEGERHQQLLKESRLAGGYIATGQLRDQDAIYGLETIASERPNLSKSQRTIRDGINYGKQAPIEYQSAS